jgi:hypothetical protein
MVALNRLASNNLRAYCGGLVNAGLDRHRKPIFLRVARARSGENLMRNHFVCVFAIVTLMPSLLGQQPGGKIEATPLADQGLTNVLDTKIKSEWQAIKSKDQKAYGELLTDDFVAVEADGGGERYRWKALSELQESSVTDYTLSFLKVIPLGPDAAFARYEVFVKFPPKSAVPFEKLLVGEIWVKREGQWKAMHYQETRVK